MLDDEIQYIGTKPALPQDHTVQAGNHPFNSRQPEVAGIVLHVERYGSEPPHALTFRKSESTVVDIGRKPGSDHPTRHHGSERGKAMFRCPVVSRNHAKIMFSNLGLVYVFDTKSHHGTYIRRSNEMVSRRIISEVSEVVADGDVLTFGKSVGKNNELVRPVVARVEILRSNPGPPFPFKPLIVPNNPPVTPKTPSGRYGVLASEFSPSSSSSSFSSSDDSSSPNNDHDSDIEEIPDPTTTQRPTELSGTYIGRAMQSLKRLLPPAHTILSPDHSHNMFPDLMGWDEYGLSPGPSELSAPFPAGLPSMPSINKPSQMHSRSHSPMDLATTPPPLMSVEDVVVRSLTGSHLPKLPPPPAEKPVSVPPPDEPEDEVVELQPPCIVPPLPGKEPIDVDASDSSPVIVLLPTPLPEPEQVAAPDPSLILESSSKDNSTEVHTLKVMLDKVQDEVNKLHAYRRKYRSRFNTNVQTVTDKISDLEEQLSDLTSLHGTLFDQLEQTVQTDIPELQDQLENIQQRTAGAIAAAAKSLVSGKLVIDALAEREDVKADVATLHDLVDRMSKLREDTEAQLARELELVKQARMDALANITEQMKQITEAVQTASRPTLKRKRCRIDTDEVGDDDIMDVTLDQAHVVLVPRTATSLNSTIIPADGIDVPRLKRSRQILSTIAHTATAVTVGAVAAWSALAFS